MFRAERRESVGGDDRLGAVSSQLCEVGAEEGRAVPVHVDQEQELEDEEGPEDPGVEEVDGEARAGGLWGVLASWFCARGGMGTYQCVTFVEELHARVGATLLQRLDDVLARCPRR